MLISGCANQGAAPSNGALNGAIEDRASTGNTQEQTYTNYVSVKFRDTKVDLANPAFEYLNTDKSSWIRGAWYDRSNRYMIINLEGTYYHYCDMPGNVWNSFKQADSFGTFYNQSIKGNYDCRKGFVPEY